MLAKEIELEVITPERLAYAEKVDFVVLPGNEGEIGILPNHAPLLTHLSIGELRITKGSETEHYAVTGGFAEVLDNHIKVFAETAEMGQEIDKERAKIAADNARAEVTKAARPQDLALAQAALRRALLRLKVSEGRNRPRR